MSNVAFGSRIAGSLFLAFALVDLLAYPEYFKQWLPMRLFASALIIGVGYSTRFEWARKHYMLVTLIIPIICALFISLFIFQTKDPTTFYYAGLNLAIAGTGALFQHSLTSSYIIIGTFTAVTLPFASQLTKHELSIYFGSYLFLISTAIITVFASRNHFKIRQDEFYLRMKSLKNEHALERTNEELVNTLVTLSRTERQLFQSEKMSFLGELSAGVIHEIGNPVSYANQALFILKKRLKKAGELETSQEVLDDIQDGLDRISGIIKNLQEFSHKGKIEGDRYFIRDSISSALRILANPIAEANVTVTGDWDDDIEVEAIKNQITQVISNLINNGIHATQQQDDKKLIINSFADRDKKQAGVSIQDNGQGISKADQKLLFDPFFTTKDPGEGTGLGLSICYRIIEAHSGEIKVDSTPGEGTTFTVILPLIQS